MKTEITARWMIVNGRLDMCWTAMETMQLLEMNELPNLVFQEAAPVSKAA
jgi:glutathionylspermidine synthase